MCLRRSGHHKKLPTRMMIPRVDGVNGARKKHRKRMDKEQAGLAAVGKNRCQFLWWNDFELGIGAVVRLFVVSPPAELCRMTKAASLHVVVSDFHHQLGSQWFPR